MLLLLCLAGISTPINLPSAHGPENPTSLLIVQLSETIRMIHLQSVQIDYPTKTRSFCTASLNWCHDSGNTAPTTTPPEKVRIGQYKKNNDLWGYCCKWLPWWYEIQSNASGEIWWDFSCQITWVLGINWHDGSNGRCCKCKQAKRKWRWHLLHRGSTSTVQWLWIRLGWGGVCLFCSVRGVIILTGAIKDECFSFCNTPICFLGKIR